MYKLLIEQKKIRFNAKRQTVIDNDLTSKIGSLQYLCLCLCLRGGDRGLLALCLDDTEARGGGGGDIEGDRFARRFLSSRSGDLRDDLVANTGDGVRRIRGGDGVTGARFLYGDLDLRFVLGDLLRDLFQISTFQIRKTHSFYMKKRTFLKMMLHLYLLLPLFGGLGDRLLSR